MLPGSPPVPQKAFVISHICLLLILVRPIGCETKEH